MTPAARKDLAAKATLEARCAMERGLREFRNDPDAKMMGSMFRNDFYRLAKVYRLFAGGLYQEAAHAAMGLDTACREQIPNRIWKVLCEEALS